MSKRPQNKNLRPHPEALGVIPLADGELSRPVRIRTSEEVHIWLKDKTAKQIGELLEDCKNREENKDG